MKIVWAIIISSLLVKNSETKLLKKDMNKGYSQNDDKQLQAELFG